MFPRKNALEDDISSIIEKDDIHPGKYGISSDRKIKDDNKVYLCKKVPVILCTFTEEFIGIFICMLSNKKTRETQYIE